MALWVDITETIKPRKYVHKSLQVSQLFHFYPYFLSVWSRRLNASYRRLLTTYLGTCQKRQISSFSVLPIPTTSTVTWRNIFFTTFHWMYTKGAECDDNSLIIDWLIWLIYLLEIFRSVDCRQQGSALLRRRIINDRGLALVNLVSLKSSHSTNSLYAQ